MEDSLSILAFFLRWLHIGAGITWIGHLYFFNFVHTPYQGVLEKELKPRVNPLLLPRALWWFRWGAMVTWLMGLCLFLVKYGWGGLFFDATGRMSDRAMWILWGALLGTIMWFNVWFVIWPAQKKLIRWTRDMQSPPEMAALAKKAGLFSRINTYLSGPMLFAMIAPNNYPTMNIVVLLLTIVIGGGAVHLLMKTGPKVGTSI